MLMKSTRSLDQTMLMKRTSEPLTMLMKRTKKPLTMLKRMREPLTTLMRDKSFMKVPRSITCKLLC
jgi:hypothetical protein